MPLRVLWVQSIAAGVVLLNTPEKSQKSVFVISWTYKRTTSHVYDSRLRHCYHYWECWSNKIIIGTLEKPSWEWLFVAIWYFCNLDRLLSHFLSRWASHWLTRELKKVTLKRAWGPRDSDSRATMWFLWVKKRPLYPPIGTNLSQFLAGWGKRGQKHLNLLVWLLPTTQHGFDYQLFAWLAKKLISPTT